MPNNHTGIVYIYYIYEMKSQRGGFRWLNNDSVQTPLTDFTIDQNGATSPLFESEFN